VNPTPGHLPGRNDPCHCGSGRKYKHCCARVESFADPFEHMSLLMYVLQQLPRTELRKLPLAGLDLEEVGHIGDQWRRGGRAADAEALLERVFAEPDRLDGRAQFAFDVLADCYDVLGHPKKKERLIERIGQARDRTLRSAALHRRITILADRGERAEAWRLFGEAQRHEPGNPMLATLELTMLMGEKKFDRMRERGQFWIARLARDREHDYGDLIDKIRELVSDPVSISLKYDAAERPGLAQLRSLLAVMPPVACHYELERAEDEAELVPTPALAVLEAQWHDLTQVAKPDLTNLDAGDPDAWERLAPGIPWLADHPLAWQSFEVLDDLALAVQDTDLMAGAESLLEPLLARTQALLRATIEQNDGGDCAIPWGFVANRPALRLLVALYYLRRDQRRADEALALARWMVIGLNPHDNHGLREEYVRLLLERGDADGALAVCDRYPDDAIVGTLFGRPLALFILGRHVDAADALRAAHAGRPNVLPMLVADDPKAPRSDDRWVEVGGKEEAWLYRRAHRALWERAGALPWARGIVVESRRPRRR